jgi:hypothetical protein
MYVTKLNNNVNGNVNGNESKNNSLHATPRTDKTER